MQSFSVKYRNKLPKLNKDNIQKHHRKVYLQPFETYSDKFFSIENKSLKVMVITFYKKQRYDNTNNEAF